MLKWDIAIQDSRISDLTTVIELSKLEFSDKNGICEKAIDSSEGHLGGF